MSIQLSENESRVSYTLAESVVQSVFAVPFEFFDDGDLLVFVNGTQKAEGADYTVVGGGGSTGSVTFSPALTGVTGGSSILIVRRIPLERVTDFLPGSDINRTALNEQLDILTAMIADVSDKADRSLRIGDADTGATLLPFSEDRKGRVLVFDGVTGNASVIPVDALTGFGSLYLGSFNSAPSTKNDGSPLEKGNLYFNAVSDILFVWDGSVWVDFTAPFGTMASQDANSVNITGGSLAGITSLTGSVVASQGEAQAGSDNTKIPTVLRVAEQTTARIASQGESQAGTNNTKLMTPLRTAEAIAALTPPVAQLTQGQAEDPASTVFGTVSGQRLGQSLESAFSGASGAPRVQGTAINHNKLGEITATADVTELALTSLPAHNDIVITCEQMARGADGNSITATIQISANNGGSWVNLISGSLGSANGRVLIRVFTGWSNGRSFQIGTTFTPLSSNEFQGATLSFSGRVNAVRVVRAFGFSGTIGIGGKLEVFALAEGYMS